MDRREDGGDHFFVVLENTLVHLPQRRQNILHEDGGRGTRWRPRGDGLVLGIENVVSPHVFDKLGLVDSKERSVELRKLAKREAPAVSGTGKKDGSIGGRNEELFFLLTVNDVGLVNREDKRVRW